MRFFINFSILFLSSITLVGAQNYDDQAKKLDSEIKRIQKQQEKDRKNKEKVRLQLRKTNKELKTVSHQLNKLDADLKNQEKLVLQLQEKTKKNQSITVQSQAALSALLVQHAKQQKPNLLQLLLSQSEVDDVDRQQAYLKYFTRARHQQLNALRISLQDVESTNKEYLERKAALKNQYKEQKKLKKSISEQTSQKSKLLKKIETGIEQNTTTIKKLKEDKKRLAALLKRLEEKRKAAAKQQSSQEFIPAKGGFSKQKGRMLLPVSGKIAVAYGKKQWPSGVRSNGIQIKAKQSGSHNVRSIYEGRVIFSNWLKGFGNLLIIEHGGGYMSLYGNNQVLNKKEGDVVAARETIATYRQGAKRPNFYFEIRNKGKAINPNSWLRK
ncbi:MAG: murein hydrolase activator EnvC family protein [Arenicella sp.]